MAVQSKPERPQQLTPFGYALAGALGGSFSNAMVYPLDTIKTRIQAANPEDENEDGSDLSVTSLALKIIKEDGFFGLYRGFAATMLNTFSMQYAYFFFYSLVRTSYIKRLAARRPAGSKAQPLSTAAELLIGALAGALAQIFTIPVAVIATRQQIGSPHHKSKGKGKEKEKDIEAGVVEDEERDDSFFGVGREIIREEGVTGLWLGIKPGLVLTVNPAITYGMFERIKSVLLLARAKAGRTDTKLAPWLSFVLGALSKTLATVVTYPYIMAKVRIQTRSVDDEIAKETHELPVHHGFHHKHGRHAGALDILLRVWRHQGPMGWYQGMGAQVLKAVLSQGVLFMSKERFEHWALAIIVLYWRLGHRQ